ncbi:MAG: AraC family transcriptional regulator [Clostridia bacterium]|nr:AraC family transcriptional regulator [Clostridia bacterium]MBQ3232102.1 AraC family transcriptional regulator [Clostridia bacterium]MBQ4619755.1 AraC family transcriptional regulator [Clostridia bacterium]
MSEKKLSVDEISLAVGYIHSSSFRRKFKQETGLSPTEYAERSEK